MTSAIIVYLLVGLISYWPNIWHQGIDKRETGTWYEWLAAWIIWTICWPYRYTMDAWYWWRAKK